MATLGQRLKELRDEKNMVQADIADLLEVSKSTIGMYEQDRRDPDTEKLNKLANYFNVSTDYLLGRTDLREKDFSLSFNTISVEGLNDEEIAAVKNMIEMLKKNK